MVASARSTCRVDIVRLESIGEGVEWVLKARLAGLDAGAGDGKTFSGEDKAEDIESLVERQ